MKNPIQVYEKIRDNFILYLETAFGTRYESFEEDRKKLLLRDKTFSRSPWVEPLPIYKASEFKIDEITGLPNMNPDELEIFKKIAKAGLIGDYKLHEHQYEMLSKAMGGSHCVITSGTGSGKTESFLLPLFAYLSKEMNKWKINNNQINNSKWWNGGWGEERIVGKGNTTLKIEVRQRPNPKRAPAVRAMLIYPMNALVEDQLARLRKALDSDDARAVFEATLNNNRIYFGRYNSTSPVSGKLFKENNEGEIVPNKYKIDQLKKELKAIEENNSALADYANQMPIETPPGIIKDLVSNFQRLDGAEMRTRFDMHETPPDIMITNFSMLSTMLMRDIENPIFDKTKDWLSCETKFDHNFTPGEKEQERKERIFHIIIDELHLYRGGSGSEIAYLIRMLLERIGLTPDSPQLRILASSASLEGEEGKNFLKSFFGTSNTEIEIINGTEVSIGVNENEFLLPRNVFEFIGEKATEIDELIKIGSLIPDENNTFSSINEFVKNEVGWNEDLLNFLVSNNTIINKQLFSAFNIDGRVRAIPAYKNGEADDTLRVKFISEVLFGEGSKENSQAVKGFFYSLGLLERLNIKHEFPRMRFHLFFKNIPGLWGELIPDEEIGERKRPVGDLISTSQINYNERRALELLYCENCGTLAFGGNRIKFTNDGGGHETELIPLSPNIEAVPENAPSLIMEKRKYNDFGIFCPGTFTANDISWIHPNTQLNGRWTDAWLDIYSGKLMFGAPSTPRSFVKGKLFRIMNGQDIANEQNNLIAKKANALPCICPYCEADYSHPKKKRQSPFRGFRTGFGKVSQIFSTELFDSLPQGDNTKKLVAFSDSREDAAKLAKNIEEEHYNSLLKQVIIHNITNELQLDNDIINCIKNDIVDRKAYFSINFENKYDEIDEIISRANKGRQEYITKLAALEENIKHINVFKDLVIREFLNFGINPAGPAKSMENFKSGNAYQPWNYFFNFQNKTYDETRDGWQNVMERITKKIEENLTSHIFGKLFYSFESSGLGYATITKKESLHTSAQRLGVSSEILLQTCNSFMRIMGDNYKHNRTEYEPTIFRSYSELRDNRKEKKYIRAVSLKLGLDETPLGNTIYQILEDNHHRGIIEINNLHIKIANPETLAYICPHCSVVHLHPSAGICTFCNKKLNIEPKCVARTLWAQSYLTAKLINNYAPFRLHTEELTGQTDNQLLRQRQFKDIFLNEIDKRTQQIDLLSVTTTLEVGVDIGSLQAILLSNMPPQRFNYQQRVGRTGRRGQLFSYALTLCRGKSHDDYYFENPLSMTGDKPPQPFLSMDQLRIFKRMLAKSVLRYAFKELGQNKGSVHGEFGNINAFNVQNLQTIIDRGIDRELLEIFNSLNVGIYKNNQIQLFIFGEVRTWLLELPGIIASKISEQQLVNGDLAEFLAEVGILPMAGMPTRIRNLIHGFNKVNNNEFESLTIDRDLDLAIYEFAPGAQKTKDKGVYQSIGFAPNTTGIERDFANGGELTPAVMNMDAFSQKKWLVQDIETKNIVSHPYLSDTSGFGKPVDEVGKKVFMGATPAAFRTDLSWPKDSNEEYDMNVSKPLTFAESGTNVIQVEMGNFVIKYAEQELTWKINDNGREQFVGCYVEQQRYGTTFNNHWVASNFQNGFTKIGQDETLSLATSKVTEIFRVEPQQLPITIDINPFSNEKFKAASSKGAFYSAAFLLQRTLADSLDIDPEEIEIAAIELLKLPEVDGVSNRISASIVLADELPNGSGFISQLYNNFAIYEGDRLVKGFLKKCINPEEGEAYNFNILSEQHINECNSSCYKDLKNYRNMNFHALLDWKLGIGLLRIFADKNYTSGLKEKDYQFPEISTWREFAEGLSLDFERSFTKIKSCKFGQLDGFTFENDFKVIIVHPFWNYTTHQPEENILTEAISIAGIENLYFVDSFNLFRRPGWCYGELIKMMSE